MKAKVCGVWENDEEYMNIQNKGNVKDEGWEHRLDRRSCGNDTNQF